MIFIIIDLNIPVLSLGVTCSAHEVVANPILLKLCILILVKAELKYYMETFGASKEETKRFQCACIFISCLVIVLQNTIT